MAEHINGQNLFASGGHQWKWQGNEKFPKRLVTAGCSGEASMVVALGGMPCVIEGRHDGEPAVLKAAGATKAAADVALNAIEQPIETLRDSGEPVAYEDDQGATGPALVIDEFVRVGGRRYGRQGANWAVWQFYRCLVRVC